MKSLKNRNARETVLNIINKYYDHEDECINFFIRAKWPEGFECECGCHEYYMLNTRKNVLVCKHCGKQHYLFANTIFQDNKLPLFKLILGMYLFFTSTKGMTAVELSDELDINYKTACLFANKCRYLMTLSNARYTLNSLFYEGDVFSIGTRSAGHPGKSSEQQDVQIVLSTKAENQYPEFIKMLPIKSETKELCSSNFRKMAYLSKEAMLNSDGTNIFNPLQKEIKIKNDKVIYTEKNHRLKYIHIIIGNVKNNIGGIYHGVDKSVLPLYLWEQEWRFNHRRSGYSIMNKIIQYINGSKPIPRKQMQYLKATYENMYCQ